MEKIIMGYKLIKEIYSSTFSSIFLATRIRDGQNFAIKRIFKSQINDKRYRRYLNNEIYILNHLESKYCIKFYHNISDSNFIYLVFEYCNGEGLDKCLQRYMEENDTAFPQEYVQHIMRQIISGFVYLHSCKIIHRDIKLSNMLVQFPTEEDKNNLNMMKATIKIADFGCARYLKGNIATSIVNFDEDSYQNMEPHMLKKLKRINDEDSFSYDQKADIWSLGTITYELLVGSHAFEASSYEELIKNIEKGEYRIPHNIKISVEALSFLSGMLRYNPNSRLDIESLSKQFFIIKDVSAFHNINLTRSENQLGQSLFINVKNDENSGFDDFLNIYGVKLDIDPSKMEGENPIIPVEKGKQINGQPKDFIGPNKDNTDSDEKNEIENENLNIEPEKEKYVNDLFDKMNKNCFLIEPLLVPNPPVDSIYNSSDPISAYMAEL
jgi:serine/threonine-protein kinase ULK/ATG1